MTRPLYRITGEVTADDDTGYTPLIWCAWETVPKMLDAIGNTARTCGDAYTLRVDRGEGTPRIAWEQWTPEEATR